MKHSLSFLPFNMSENSTTSPEDKNTPEKQSEVDVDKKPWLFRRVMNGIRETPKFITKIVKGVDKVIMHIPVAGEIYGATKGLVSGAWRASEQIPFLWDVTREVRKGAQSMSNKIWFTEPEEQKIMQSETALMTSLWKVRDNIVQQMPESETKDDLIAFYDELMSQWANWDIQRDKMEGILQKFTDKHPDLKPFIQAYIDEIAQSNTGKGWMSVQQLIEDGKKLEQKILDSCKDKNVPLKWALEEKEYSSFRKIFTSLPDFSTVKQNPELSSLLQNMYFGREPKPDIGNPLVKDFIQKSINLALVRPNDPETYKTIFVDHHTFVEKNWRELADLFHLNEVEKTLLEHRMNYKERLNRLPPDLPYGYSWPDYGLGNLRDAVENKLLPNTDVERAQRKLISESISAYRWTTLSLFQGGGH